MSGPTANRRVLSAIGASLLLVPCRAFAYRPFDLTDADIAAPREIELEVGPLAVVRTRQGTQLEPGFVVNFGLSQRLELVVEGQEIVPIGPRQETLQWETAPALLLKGLLRRGSLQGQSGPSMALEAGVLTPLLPLEEGFGASLAFITSQQWPALTIHVNAQAVWTRDHHADGIGGVIIEGPHRWAVRPVAETFVERESPRLTTVSGLAGAIWEIREGLSVDAAARRAREDGLGVFEVRAGMTWAFAL
jgi:hypothetical protein